MILFADHEFGFLDLLWKPKSDYYKLLSRLTLLKIVGANWIVVICSWNVTRRKIVASPKKSACLVTILLFATLVKVLAQFCFPENIFILQALKRKVSYYKLVNENLKVSSKLSVILKVIQGYEFKSWEIA